MLFWMASAAFAGDGAFFAGDLERTGRILVRADDPAAIAALPDVARVRTLRGGLLAVVPLPGADDLALARALHARKDVRWAQPDVILPARLFDLPDDSYVRDEWHLENTGQGGRTVDVDIDAETAWEFATGAGLTIAIIDSGVQLDHPDLRVTAGHDYIDKDDDPSPNWADTWGGPHGTCSAGVAAGAGGNGAGVAGVAYDADVYAIRLIGGNTSTQDLYNTFTEAVDAGAVVLSNSWGYGTDCSGIPNYSVFDDMFEYAETQGRGGLGAVVVFAAGNGGCDTDGDGMLAHEEPIVVAALEGNDRRAGYSNFGDVVDIAAPTGLLTTDLFPGGYGSYGGQDEYTDGFSGTSAATPVVSGVAALMIEANPRITAAEVREVLCETAVRVDLDNVTYDEAGRSPYYGCGRIDAGAAVATVANGEPAAPVAAVVEQVYAPHAVLAWAPAADPDGDVLFYELEWSANGGDAAVVEVPGTSYDVGPEIAAGDLVTWRVRAVDPWGEGPWSDSVGTQMILAPEPVTTEPARGCAHAPGGVGLLGVIALIGGRARRPAPRDQKVQPPPTRGMTNRSEPPGTSGSTRAE